MIKKFDYDLYKQIRYVFVCVKKMVFNNWKIKSIFYMFKNMEKIFLKRISLIT